MSDSRKPFDQPLTDAELDDLVFSPAIEADEIVAVSARPRMIPRRVKYERDVEGYIIKRQGWRK